MIFIGNCRYEPDGLAPSRRERLDDGLLECAWSTARRLWRASAWSWPS